jgi:hypothetical protein
VHALHLDVDGMTAVTAFAAPPVPHHHDRCIDHLLWLASRARDTSNWAGPARDAELEHIYNGVIASVSAMSRASDRASHGITLQGRWQALCYLVEQRESYEIGDVHASHVLGRDITDDEAAGYPVSQECRDRLDAAVMAAARELYFGQAGR